MPCLVSYCVYIITNSMMYRKLLFSLPTCIKIILWHLHLKIKSKAWEIWQQQHFHSVLRIATPVEIFVTVVYLLTNLHTCNSFQFVIPLIQWYIKNKSCSFKSLQEDILKCKLNTAPWYGMNTRRYKINTKILSQHIISESWSKAYSIARIYSGNIHQATLWIKCYTFQLNYSLNEIIKSSDYKSEWQPQSNLEGVIRICHLLQLYSSKKFCTTCTIFMFSPKYCKLLGKQLMFIDKTLKWWLVIKIVINHASFNFSCCYNRWNEVKGVAERILQKSQLLKFYLLLVRTYRGKIVTFEVLYQFLWNLARW